MASNYNGNLVELRKRRFKIIEKRSNLRKQLKDNGFTRERLGILNKIESLNKEIDKIEKEILKVQKGMQNSDKWMDGNYNIVEL